MGITRKKKKCKCCGKEGYIFGHGLIEQCYRAKKQQEYQSKRAKENLFAKKPVLPPDKKKSLVAMIGKAKKLKQRSSKNSYRDSEGNRWTSEQIENEIKKAKKVFHDTFKDEHGYIYCEDCQREFEESGAEKKEGCEIIDISHDISVDQCKNNPKIPLELAWDWENNFTFRGRRHHRIHDKSY